MKQNQNTILQLVKLIMPFKWSILLAISLGFLTIGSSIGLMGTSAFIIASAALHPALGSLMVPITGVRFFGISRGLFRYAERITSHNTTFKILSNLRTWFYKKIEPLAPAKIQNYQSGDLTGRIIADIETLEHFFVSVVAPPIVAILVSFAMFIFLGYFDVRIAITFLIFFLLAGTLSPFIANISGKTIGKQVIEVRSKLYTNIIDTIHGLADLTANNQEYQYLEKINKLNKQFSSLQSKLVWINALHNGIETLLANIGMVIVLVIAIPIAQSNGFDAVMLAVIAMSSLSSFEATATLPQAFLYLEKIKQAASRIFEIANETPAINDIPKKSPVPQNYSIHLQEVSFGYLKEKKVLDSISLNIQEGKHIAIVGPSGAGKSTIANLLLRFWDYNSGEITFGSYPLKNYRPDDVIKYFAMVSQDTYLFNTTIEENLKMANPKATKQEVYKAIEQAQLTDFINNLPNGLETYVGEFGLAVSGGERQRIAIARALLKDAPILILDEVTANLDVITEKQILKTIEDISKNKTRITITHRLVNMENNEMIYVLNKGKIVEQGTHFQLINKKGLYYNMFRIQNQLITDIAI